MILSKIKEKLATRKNKVTFLACTSVPVFMIGATSIPAFAEAPVSSPSINDTLVSSFTDIGNQILSFFGQVLPIALPILGASMVIGIGIAIFKKVTKKASGG